MNDLPSKTLSNQVIGRAGQQTLFGQNSSSLIQKTTKHAHFGLTFVGRVSLEVEMSFDRKRLRV